ncbi:MAG TPA: cadmium-containing carbonic anhydrase [Candidatus Saccharibacteria bacterium]|nr:cadmium-containing carbonic anhydrase [Candidatus Saccharibacteria bacterium]
MGDHYPTQEQIRASALMEEIIGMKALEQTVIVEPQLIDLGQVTSEKWPGLVSVKNLRKEGIVGEDTLDKAVERLNEFYVPVNPNAKTRCIDGRHDPKLDEKHLGPQVPGGAPGAALAYRLGVDKDDLTRGTFLVDAEAMIGNFERIGFAPGGHRDEHSESDQNKVGCGAIDGMDAILRTMTDPRLVDDHKRVVKQILGPFFDRDIYLRVMGAGLVLRGNEDDYFRDREKIIDILEKKSKDSVSVLKGDHQEGLWVINMVPNETFSSNRFAEEFDGLQAFGYDLWRSIEMAEKILPRPDQQIDRHRFIMARVMSTTATLMALTDGTQRFVLRMPA